jgi:hypothetical protein
VRKGELSVNKKKKRDRIFPTNKGLCYAIAFLGMKVQSDKTITVADTAALNSFLENSFQKSLEIGEVFDSEGMWRRELEDVFNIGLDKGLAGKENNFQSAASSYFLTLGKDEFNKLMIPAFRNLARTIAEKRFKRQSNKAAELLSD